MSAIETAKGALGRFQRHGARAAAVPTPERLLRDAGHARVERTLEFVPIMKADGQTDVATIRAAHVRVTGEAFERLGARCLLAPGDVDRNAVLLRAARRFHSNWYKAGLVPLRGQDPGKIRSTAIGDGLLGSEWACEAFKDHWKAVLVMDRRERIAVEAIVLHDKLAVWVGSKISGQSDKGGSKAVAMDNLKAGLEKLAIHYGMLTPSDPMEDVMAGLLAAADVAEAARA